MVPSEAPSLLRLESTQRSADWCVQNHCWEIGWFGGAWIWNTPSSTLFVVLLILVYFYAGWVYLSRGRGQPAFLWIGASFVLDGLAAIPACVSYQMFAYEIKCAGREVCDYTSWWEIVYSILQAWALPPLVIGVIMLYFGRRWFTGVRIFSFLHAAIYSVLIVVGVFAQDIYLVSWTFLIHWITPGLLLCAGIFAYSWLGAGQKSGRRRLLNWVALFAVYHAYLYYSEAGYTAELYHGTGLWFSDNDVLHVGLIAWVFHFLTAFPARGPEHRLPT